jgi:hypothetical protein
MLGDICATTGGLGVDFNLVILTAAIRGDFGANHANWVHRYLVEGQLLWAYRNMHGLFGVPTVSEIYYYVKADYNRKPRERTKELKKIVDAYEEVALRAAELRAGDGSSALMHLDVMSLLAQNPPSPHLHDAFVAVKAKNRENWWRVHQRMKQNQQLWEFEDANVPLALQIRYSVVENGVLTGPFSETVPIVLPFSLAARFRP